MIEPIGHTTLQIPTFRLDDLTLRAPAMSDLDAYAEFRASDRAKGVGGPNTRVQAEQKLEALIGHWHLHGFGRWMVTETHSDTPLGVVGLMAPCDWPEPEIAWSVFAGAEGKSVAYRAAIFARRYAYEVLGWSTVISCTTPDNHRSQALAQRMGATRDGECHVDDVGRLLIWRHLSAEAV
ncbi:MAG: GNAT family N-acetyltransferase [Rhodobacteraceae bacterium]|nr:GNAT family N-acetyltransferase [Paracoccaceae bacterium]